MFNTGKNNVPIELIGDQFLQALHVTAIDFELLHPNKCFEKTSFEFGMFSVESRAYTA